MLVQVWKKKKRKGKRKREDERGREKRAEKNKEKRETKQKKSFFSFFCITKQKAKKLEKDKNQRN